MTFEQAFQKVKAKFDGADVSKLTNEFAIQVNMTDEDCGGAFYIQYADGKLNVEPYDYRDNTADVTLKKLDLYKILDGKLTVAKAVESGKAYINGNAEDFTVVAGCIVVPEKKPVVKRTAKKAEKPAEKTPATAKAAKEALKENKTAKEKKLLQQRQQRNND